MLSASPADVALFEAAERSASLVNTVPTSAELMRARFHKVRARTLQNVQPLGAEDLVVQSMPDASPAKWHLAHTTWFFETFLLLPNLIGYTAFNASYAYLFNSYYESIGPRQPRPHRGLITRPTSHDIFMYRKHVDRFMDELLTSVEPEQIADMFELGIAHEEQHQELLLMDILHLFDQSPLKPAYIQDWPNDEDALEGEYRSHSGGLLETGSDGIEFSFDNEQPVHKTWIDSFDISDQLVTNGQWLRFIDAGGYRQASYWLADGWATVQAEGWTAPLYWSRSKDGFEWLEMTLGGLRLLSLDAPVTHISYYEATAFASWAGARLPTEEEWEASARDGLLRNATTVAWQWTQSAYRPYPGFQAAKDASGEYNGKFMVGQMVLRGGSSFTPHDHARATYRNFFRPEQRWMRSGLRLAKDTKARTASIDLKKGFARDTIRGLSTYPKQLSPKYFYDEKGSALFEEICKVPEYYPTRTETKLLNQIAGEIGDGLTGPIALVEFGSGASEKTRILLDAIPSVKTYVPVDISPDAIAGAVQRLENAYPDLILQPVVGDFTQAIEIPRQSHGTTNVGFFPGSTIGNFRPTEAIALLKSFRSDLGAGSKLIVGFDMIKDAQTLVAAYDDAAGVTARFNQNLLLRINRDLQGDFDPDAFKHLAVWNNAKARIEMHLVSQRDQRVQVFGRAITFRQGESIHTESSHKFSERSFSDLATSAGWVVDKFWQSAAPTFGIVSLSAP